MDRKLFMKPINVAVRCALATGHQSATRKREIMQVTDIIFGDPVTPVARATQGDLQGKLITIAKADVNVINATSFVSGRMKVQYSVGGRPKPQVSRYVEVNNLLVAVHLDEKE